MNTQVFRPADILLFKPQGWGLLTPLVKAIVSYGHVAMYFTETKRGLPLVIESIGRGVLIRSLYSYSGQTVHVMRANLPEEKALEVTKQAERLADNPSCWYGYFDIPRFVLPKLILVKAGAWLPLKWQAVLNLLAGSYRQNNFYICSELVVTAYQKVGVPLFNVFTIPLPDDIARSPLLTDLGEMTINEKSLEKEG
jgi:uncharacterized protein YycO